MQRNRIIVFVAALAVAVGGALPSAALAGATGHGGPLLSGYGGPGAGPQTLIGATLVNGPAGGSGGSAGGGSAPAAASTAGVSSAPTPTRNAGASGSRPAGASPGRRTARPGSHAPATHTRAAGAHPNSTQLGTSSFVADDSHASWFSGADLLAVVLAAGVLALVALATVRLTRTEHD